MQCGNSSFLGKVNKHVWPCNYSSELKRAAAKLKNCCAGVCLMDSKWLAWKQQRDKAKTTHTERDLPWSPHWNEKAEDSGVRERL